eukprot:COSAG02_NODE_297_length_25355_cov_78.632998_11_plen_144_part_00
MCLFTWWVIEILWWGTVGPLTTDFSKLFSRACDTDIYILYLYKKLLKVLSVLVSVPPDVRLHDVTWVVEEEGSRDGRGRGMGGVAGWEESRDGRSRGMGGVAGWEESRDGRSRGMGGVAGWEESLKGWAILIRGIRPYAPYHA